MKSPAFYFGTNLKMYQTATDTAAFLSALAAKTLSPEQGSVTRFVIPSFTSLPAAGGVDRNGILLGAQNMHWEEQGQFTGEISPLMLKDLGCVDLIEIGHSERRHVFGETDKQCNLKVKSALSHGFIALLCVGETLEQKEAGISREALAIQLKLGLRDVPGSAMEEGRVWIAYEPVWAIGVRGIPAQPDYVGQIHRQLRAVTRELYPEASKLPPLLFGGSVSPDNACGYVAQDDVDGLFVGRAAWTAETFHSLMGQAYTAYASRA